MFPFYLFSVYSAIWLYTNQCIISGYIHSRVRELDRGPVEKTLIAEGYDECQRFEE